MKIEFRLLLVGLIVSILGYSAAKIIGVPIIVAPMNNVTVVGLGMLTIIIYAVTLSVLLWCIVYLIDVVLQTRKNPKTFNYHGFLFMANQYNIGFFYHDFLTLWNSLPDVNTSIWADIFFSFGLAWSLTIINWSLVYRKAIKRQTTIDNFQTCMRRIEDYDGDIIFEDLPVSVQSMILDSAKRISLDLQTRKLMDDRDDNLVLLNTTGDWSYSSDGPFDIKFKDNVIPLRTKKKSSAINDPDFMRIYPPFAELPQSASQKDVFMEDVTTFAKIREHQPTDYKLDSVTQEELDAYSHNTSVNTDERKELTTNEIHGTMIKTMLGILSGKSFEDSMSSAIDHTRKSLNWEPGYTGLPDTPRTLNDEDLSNHRLRQEDHVKSFKEPGSWEYMKHCDKSPFPVGEGDTYSPETGALNDNNPDSTNPVNKD